MLLGYGGKNCWCFKDWMQVDLSLGDSVPLDVSMGLPASTAMCFKGANASGKTNALKIYSFLYDFVTYSFSDRADKPIMFASFFHNEDPAEFYVEFLANEIYYRYEL
ncbi:MAG: ATP-binding protein, partial [Treponema sp.]|nr:ATP-binding protein [Treponema sp.]